jgi:membrane associated rhomboid family serine protease
MRGFAGSPTLQTLAVMGVVFVVQQVLQLVGLMGFFFVLSPSFFARPWSLVTSVYAHANLTHLLGNALVLLPVGLAIESFTSRVRYHAFFVTTGVIAGLSQVFLTGSGVLGASAAIFALLGYLVTGNPVSNSVLDRLGLDRRVQLVVFGVLAVLVTIFTGSPGVALVAHFTGFLLGLVGGRLGVLGTSEPRHRTQVTNRPPGY